MSLNALNARYQSSSHLASILMRRCGAQIVKRQWKSNLLARELSSRAMDGLVSQSD